MPRCSASCGRAVASSPSISSRRPMRRFRRGIGSGAEAAALGFEAHPGAHTAESETAHRLHALHHHLETAADQMAAFRGAGFTRVECFARQLPLAVIGGYTPS